MGARVALLTNRSDVRPCLWSRVCECPAVAEGRVIRSGLGSLAQLLHYGPDLVVAGGLGAAAFQAALYRSLARRSRLLLCAADTPRSSSLWHQAILDRADSVLAEGNAVAHGMERLLVPAWRIFSVVPSFDLDLFLRCARVRPAPDAHRMVYAGELSPQSGAADLLAGVAAYAERQPGRSVEIWWAGEGDLAGVLAAQPLPANVSQRFVGPLDAPGLAGAFARCGLLVVPSLAGGEQAHVAQGLAAGLPVVGSRRSSTVRQLVHEGANGWLFDPLQPADVLRAVSRALDTPAGQLDRMRREARMSVRSPASRDLTGQLGRAVAAALSAPAWTPPRLPLVQQAGRQLARLSTPAR